MEKKGTLKLKTYIHTHGHCMQRIRYACVLSHKQHMVLKPGASHTYSTTHSGKGSTPTLSNISANFLLLTTLNLHILKYQPSDFGEASQKF